MNVSTMRLVDAWVGVPLAAALSTLRWLAKPFGRTRPKPVRRFLFVKMAEQGSTVLAHAAIQRAVEKVGRENVYFLLFEQNRFILDAMEVIPTENVITIRTRSIPGTALSTVGAIRRIRKLKIDVAVDLEFFARSSAILSFLSGAPRRIGLHAFTGDGPWRGDLMTHRLQYNPHIHTAQLFRLQVDAVDCDPGRFPALGLQPTPLAELPRGRISPTTAELETVRATIREATGCTEIPRLVLLNANCSDLMPLRKWSEERYLELANRLLDRDSELRIALTGAPDEAAAIAPLVHSIGSPRCVSLAGKTTMRELLALYEIADVLVTNDSGPAHFATLTSIDVVVLFGPETPVLFRGLSDKTHVLWAQTACSPCVSAYNNRLSACRYNVCMQQITVDQVFAEVTGILAERGHQSSREVEGRPAARTWPIPRPAAQEMPSASPHEGSSSPTPHVAPPHGDS